MSTTPLTPQPAATTTGRAILVCGVPASGKTTFGRELARHLGYALLDLDTVTNPLFEYVGGEFLVDVPTAEAPTRATVNDVRYQCLFDTAAEIMSVGVSVVVIAPFTSERTFPAAWARVPVKLGVDDSDVTLAWVDTPKEEVVARMIKRGADRDLDKIERPDVFLTPDVTRAPGVDHVRVDGLLTVPAQIAAFEREYFAASPAAELAG
ncbi:AAA family ATPase [Frondihabitans australicus]|uniref:Putative kinase n=1 Tax=Frondihabitans australicus TaxID=386892 RepID=A0A495IIQ6_9MICO|nr:ATP-binding protein [Frondihabitans australicus]RKR75191.1 putative kinase [Frondihabitans australicus]